MISANSQPFAKEMVAVQRMAQQAGVNIQRGLDGGGAHSGKSGAIRETIVLLREISRGNWTRVPGSFSLLLQQMGVLKLLTGSTASSARILADAWQAQSEKAHLAAIAATRKAAASAAAFAADEAETTATLEQAVADEEAAGAAIMHAKATQAKAVASMEAAAASGVEATASVGALGIIGAAIAGVAIAAGLLWYRIRGMTTALEDLKKGDFTPSYIPKHLQGINQAVEGQKKINEEVRKTVELYGSVAERSKRAADISKEHFEHLRKMNEFVKDPRKRAAGEIEINAKERVDEIARSDAEKHNLERESADKKKAADALRVTSKEQDEENIKRTKANADEADKYIKTRQPFGGFGDKSSAIFHGGLHPQDALDAAQSAEAKRVTDAQAAIQAHKDAVNQAAANDVIRKRKDELTKQAEDSAAKAAALGLSIPDLQKSSAQKSADEAAEKEAELKSNQKNIHGKVNSLQQVGAYAQPGTMETIAHKSLSHLASIDHQLKNLGGHSAAVSSKGKY